MVKLLVCDVQFIMFTLLLVHCCDLWPVGKGNHVASWQNNIFNELRWSRILTVIYAKASGSPSMVFQPQILMYFKIIIILKNEFTFVIIIFTKTNRINITRIHNGSLSALTLRTIIIKQNKTLKNLFKLFFIFLNYILYDVHYSDILFVVGFDSSTHSMNRATGYSSQIVILLY